MMVFDRNPCISTALESNSIHRERLKSMGFWFEPDPRVSEETFDLERLRHSKNPTLDSLLLRMHAARVATFQEYLQTNPDITNYSLSLRTRVLGVGRYLSLATIQDQYLGGAHGNYFYWCDLVDLETLQVLSLKKFYEPSFLASLGDRYMREYCRQKPNIFCAQETRDSINDTLGLTSDFSEAPLCAARTGIFVDFEEMFSHADGHQELFIDTALIPRESNTLRILIGQL